MKFGKVAHPEEINFKLPPDHEGTADVLHKYGDSIHEPAIYIGCAKWNKSELKNFYPRGTKDELAYYSSQFNSIELNATFYRIFPPEQFDTWREKTPEGFMFFPKINGTISHYRQLENVRDVVDEYLLSVTHLQHKLGTIFLQMHDRFSPKYFHRLESFILDWPTDLKLTVELRHTEWYSDIIVREELYGLLESRGVGLTLVDTAGRRDMLHMRLTTPTPFVRWVGANYPGDYQRLDDWVNRIESWTNQGMKELYFFVHQNVEEESPLLSAYLIQQLNDRIGCQLKVPATLHPTPKLF